MPISVGEALPDSQIFIRAGEGGEIKETTLAAWAEGGRVVLFSVPGAFTPTCSARHLPSYIENYDVLIARGVARVGCLSVNDAYVMGAWGRSSGVVSGTIDMLADPRGLTSAALGLAVVETPVLGNIRSARMALIAEGGIVERIFLEDAGAYEVSSAEHVLGSL